MSAMFRSESVQLVVAIIAACSATAVGAAAPVLQSGQCTYLVGAPAGTAEAASEQRDQDSGFRDDGDPEGCVARGRVSATTNGVGENTVQAFIDQALGPRLLGNCLAHAWVSHDFEGNAQAPMQSTVRMYGAFKGLLFDRVLNEDNSREVQLLIEVLERDPEGEWAVVARRDLLRAPENVGQVSVAWHDEFNERLELRVLPERTYRVRLRLEVFLGDPSIVDFGSEGSGRYAGYDSIEVCLGEPDDHEEVLESIEANAAGIAGNSSAISDNADAIADNAAGIAENSAKLDLLAELLAARERDRLEWELLNKDCRAGVWLPEARGGRLEEARALVAGLVAEATASGAPGVNAKTAEDRLATADELVAAGDYQKACQRLSDALRALTTP